MRTRLAVAAALIALPPVLDRALPGPFDQYHLLIGCFGVAYLLAALPLNLLMGYAGQISLGHAGFLGVGAYASGLVAGRAGLPFLLGLAVGAVAGGVVALVIGLPALRIRGLYLALVTLGFGLAMSSMVFRLDALSRGYAGLPVPRPQAGTFVFQHNGDLLALVTAIAVAVWLLDRNLERTKVGRAFFALRENEDVAAAAGVDVPRYKVYAFVLYGAFSGVAGSVLGHVIGFAQVETFSFELSLLFVIVVVIGGLGSRPGVAVAAVTFAILPRAFAFLKGWELVVGPLGLAYALVRHPGGLGEALRHRARPPVRDDAEPTPSLVLPVPVTDVRPDGLPLQVRDLSVAFGGLRAAQDVSMDVVRGRITGLIGPNGAGKTTVFNAISGFVRPSGGRIVLNGTDVTSAPAHRRAALGLGRTFQDLGLIKAISVTENLLLAQHRFASYGAVEALLHAPRVGRSERELRDRAAETLGALGFERYADTLLRELSHGQQRIVELASALLTAPSVLLLDEPSAGMSPAAAEALAERLLHVRDELGQTILLIEHHLPLVLATCDTIHVMDAGRMLSSGTPDEIRNDPAVVSAYLGERVA